MKPALIRFKGKATLWPASVWIHTDGASRGNPGPASTGLTVHDQKNIVLYEEATLLKGTQTNNFSEYFAVFRALKLSVKNKINSLVLKSDSELVVRQLKGLYKVKSRGLLPLYEQCKQLRALIPSVLFEHTPREQNTRADELANLILDGKNL